MDADGTLWRNMSSALDHLDAGDNCCALSLPQVSHLAPDPQHGVWIATLQGLFFADNNGVQEVSIGLEKYTLAPTERVAVDITGTIWAATLSGLQRLDTTTQRWINANADVSLPYDLNDSYGARVLDLAAAPDGSLWISTMYGTSPLQHYSGGRLTPLVAPANCAGIFKPQIDHAGHLWFANAWCGILGFHAGHGNLATTSTAAQYRWLPDIGRRGWLCVCFRFQRIPAGLFARYGILEETRSV